MKRLYRLFIFFIITAVIVCGSSAGFAEAALPQIDDCFTKRDLYGTWDATAVEILLVGETAETRSHVVDVNNGRITIQDGGVYAINGTLYDGSIIIDVPDDERVQLVLNGVDITSTDGPAIYVMQSDKVFITLAEGTENSLTSVAFTKEGIEAVIYSDEDLTFNGAGSLTITTTQGDGIDGKDDVKFTGGTYIITASGRGIDSNDSIRILDGNFTITTDGDAIRARHENNEDLGYVYIWGGNFAITTGDGSENGPDHTETFGPGGGRQLSRDGAMPMMEDFTRSGGEMPASENSTDESDDMPTSEASADEEGRLPMPEGFTGEGGERPAPGDFSGEIPTPPDFGGDMPAAAESAEEEDGVSAKGIKTSGDIVLLGGCFTFDTADDSLHANRNLTLFDGVLTISSGDDAIHADNTLSILGGTTTIEQSYEGLEGKVIRISSGDTFVNATDDGLNAADGELNGESFDAQEGVLIDISGGTLRVNAGGDGLDSNGDLQISGGDLVISGPEDSFNGSIDYNGTAIITGGTLVAAGASGMTENFSEGSTQAAFLVTLSGETGEIIVTDSKGETIISATVEKTFGTVVISAPGLSVGETYTVTCEDASTEITLMDIVTGSDVGGMANFPGDDAMGAKSSAQG